MNEYLSREDWRVRANANQGYSLGGLILNVSGKVTANYWLDEVYSPEIGIAHREGDLHIHDLDMLAGYCAGWSLRTLLNEGFNGIPGRVEAGPPKHLSSALGQMVNFLGTLQNEWAGAQAFSSFDTYLAPFVRKDGLGFAEIRQAIVAFHEDTHNLAEGAGAAALAAAMQEREHNRGERIGVVLSGTNIDRDVLAGILAEPRQAAGQNV